MKKLICKLFNQHSYHNWYYFGIEDPTTMELKIYCKICNKRDVIVVAHNDLFYKLAGFIMINRKHKNELIDILDRLK